MTTPAAWGLRLSWPELQGPPRRLWLQADAQTCAAIALDLGLEGLSGLTADVGIRPWLDGVEFEGRVRATAARLCGLTLEPFDEVIDDTLQVRVVPKGSPNAPQADDGEIVIDLDADDPPDEAQETTVDLCAYVTEAVALALDPFPRKPGAVFSPPLEPLDLSPFAVLSRLVKPAGEA